MGSILKRPVFAVSGWLRSFSPRLLLGGGVDGVLIGGCAVAARQAGAPTHVVATVGFAAIILQVMLLRWLSQGGTPSASLVQQGLVHQLGPDRGRRQGSMYDGVSGLYTRWYLELRLQEEIQRCRRYGLSMAVIVIRLAGLGLEALSTDRWARLAGELGQVASQTVRAVDITASLGALEFAVCLVQCDRAGAERAIERLHRELAAQEPLIGLAVYPADDADPAGLISRARQRAQPALPAERAG